MGKTLLILGLLISLFLIGCASFSSGPASEIESRNFSNQTSGDVAVGGFGAAGAAGPAGAPAPAAAPQMEELLPSQSKALAMTPGLSGELSRRKRQFPATGIPPFN